MPTKKRVLNPAPQAPAVPQAGLPAAPAPEAPLTLPRFSGKQRLLIYPLCVLFPPAGFTLAALYLSQAEKPVRGFGWTCLALSALGAVLKAQHASEFRGWEAGDSLVQPFY